LSAAGYKAILAFYNQTRHMMTMAAGFRAIGRPFKVDDRLAKDMLKNAENAARYVDKFSGAQGLRAAWEDIAIWLKESSVSASNLDHSAMVYESNALAYLTWTKLCTDKVAENYAGEHLTVIEHPDRHPGIGAIKTLWTVEANSGKRGLPATLPNVAAIIERMTERQDGP
jgi:hypothetical protein